MAAVWLQKLRLRPSFSCRGPAVNHGYFLSVSCCSPPGKIQEIWSGPVLCAPMELCLLRRLGDLFPVGKSRKTRMKLPNGSRWWSGREECGDERRAIFWVRGSGGWASRSASSVSGGGESRFLVRSLRLFSQRPYNHWFLVPRSLMATLIRGPNSC